MTLTKYWPYRLTVRTEASQALNRSSILRRVTKAGIQKDWIVPVFFAFVKAQGCFVSKRNPEPGSASTYVCEGVIARRDLVTCDHIDLVEQSESIFPFLKK